MNDSFGDRFKRYESATQTTLMARSNMLLRVDGRSFHTYTRSCKRPFDDHLMYAMDQTAIELCQEVQGAKLGYVQSDEITVWATGYDSVGTDTWFGGNVQKTVSIAASVATATFNRERLIWDCESPKGTRPKGWPEGIQGVAPLIPPSQSRLPLAHFDARVFLVPDLFEVANAFKWRADDCSRNSIQMLARSLYSHHELEGKSTAQLHDLMHAKGVNWNDLEPRYKRGRLIKRVDTKWQVVDLTDFTFDYWIKIVMGVAPLPEA